MQCHQRHNRHHSSQSSSSVICFIPSLLSFSLLILLLLLLPSSIESAKRSSSASSDTVTRSAYLLNKPQCTDKEQKKMDYLIAKIAVTGKYGRRLPETVNELKKFCKDTHRMVAKVEAFFKNCYTSLVRVYANLLVYSLRDQMRKHCGGGKVSKVAQKWLRLAPCANRDILIHDNKCQKQFINSTTQLLDVVDDKLKIHHTCCNLAQAMKCSRDFLETIDCIRPHIEELMALVRTHSSSNLETMCGVYHESTEACSKLKQITSEDRRTRTGRTRTTQVVKKEYITPAFLMIDLLESIGSIDSLPKLEI